MEISDAETKKTLNRMSHTVTKLQEQVKKKKPKKLEEVKCEEELKEEEEEEASNEEEENEGGFGAFKLKGKKPTKTQKESKAKGRQVRK